MAKSRISLPSLPALPSSSKPRRLRACSCGCGTPTASTFAPGHDSKLKGWVIRFEMNAAAIREALADWPNMLKQVEAVAAMRAEGRNVSFMRNVELPEPKVEGPKEEGETGDIAKSA